MDYAFRATQRSSSGHHKIIYFLGSVLWLQLDLLFYLAERKSHRTQLFPLNNNIKRETSIHMSTLRLLHSVIVTWDY